MSKKLVKTAKQQFEERLRELGNHVAVEIKGEIFHSGIDKEGKFHILRISNGLVEYSEFDYGCSLLELYENEEFLDKLSVEFAIGREGIKPILEWWSDADKNHEPFDLSDIVKFARPEKVVEFIDKEIEDEQKVFTAREKWDAASVVAKTLWSNDAETLKVEQTESFVRFYRADDILSCYEYPSLEEMRKDETFSIRIMEVLVESCQTEHLGKFLNWVKRGGSFPLPIEIIFHSEYQGYKFTEYEDDRKYSPKHDFKKEIDALRNKMLENIILLCEQGMTVNMDSLTKRISLVWEDNSFVYTEDIEDMFVKKTDNGEWGFSYTPCISDRTEEYPFKHLSIETLQLFIEAMQ